MPTMVVMILMDEEKLEDVVNAWSAAGSTGITIIESSGARHLLHTGVRDDLPMFPSLHTLLAHQEVHHRTLLTVLDDKVDIEALFDATERVVGDMTQPDNGLMVALPVTAVRGLRETGL